MNAIKLVVILLVVLVAVFLAVQFLIGTLIYFSFPEPNIYCLSSDPAKLNVKFYQVKASGSAGSADIANIKLANLTGGDITNVSCVGSNAFEQAIGPDDGCAETVNSGGEIVLLPDAASNPGNYQTSTIQISYTNYANLHKNAAITCSGPITVN